MKILTKIENTLFKIFSDDAGNLSFTRVVVGFVLFTILFNWTYFNFKNGEIYDLGWTEISALISALAAKGWSKVSETKIEISKLAKKNCEEEEQKEETLGDIEP